ncbi:MAG: HDOD domain-containing protein, partial [Armatimonadota bacterium]
MFGRLSARIDLPSAPSALAHVIHAATDKHATTHDLAAAVLTDPSLTAKVLRIANSAQHSD